MDEQRLWAPWRLGYVSGGDAAAEPAPPTPIAWRDGADHDCFLCRAAASYENLAVADRQLLIVARGDHIVTLLNRYPYTNGHLLIAPLRHEGRFTALSTSEHEEVAATLSMMMQRMETLLRAEGFNVGLNLGRVAGAGVPGHLHWHLVPRWSGDNNFLPTVSGTRIISQSLDAAWEMLTAGG